MDKKSGYILILSLMLVSVAVTLITSVVQRAISYQRQARLVLDREKARTLALGGIEIARAQLALIIPKEQKNGPAQSAYAGSLPQSNQSSKPEDKTKEEEAKQPPQQRWFGQLVTLINAWQQFSLTDKADGIDGIVQLHISSEQGKLAINQLLPLMQPKPAAQNKPTPNGAPGAKPATPTNPPNAQAQETNKPLAVVLNELLAPAVGNGQFFASVEQLKKQLGRGFEDATELLQAKDMQTAFQEKITLMPGKKPDKQTVYLTDLFTIHSGSGRINPWFISNSFGSLLGFTQKEGPRDTKEWVKNFKPFMQWQSVWDKLLMPTFGKSYASLPKEITALFSLQFEATAFFVLSYGTVGGITQKVAALLEKDTVPAELSPQSVIFKITKLYWL
ncbi:hypothetical protein H0X48_03815 [Candidatus Dependentiae bacterium]|nr:hypothetical protein [Candidatus Dependentiae bacterium]